ncbi:MAG: hypothetical protein AAF570_25515, partial [Bacteroidota bacterium]
MSISILGILVAQSLWIYQSYQEHFDRFRMDINECAMEAGTKLTEEVFLEHRAEKKDTTGRSARWGKAFEKMVQANEEMMVIKQKRDSLQMPAQKQDLKRSLESAYNLLAEFYEMANMAGKDATL